MLRFEAIVHNTRALGCGRVLERFPEIVTRLAAMTDRFTTMLDCVDIAALLVLRDQIIAPILAGVRSPRNGRKPATWTRIDRDYETLRINMQSLFHDLGIATDIAAAAA